MRKPTQEFVKRPAGNGGLTGREFVQWFRSNLEASDEDGCLLWTGSTCSISGKEYGQLGMYALLGHLVPWRPHRLALWLDGCPVGPRDRVTWTCGNTLCCHPAHLTTERPPAKSRPQVAPRVVDCAECGTTFTTTHWKQRTLSLIHI